MVQLQKGEQRCFEKDIKSNGYIVSNSPIMKALTHQIDEDSKHFLPVLILGEDGTGKRMIATEIFKKQCDKKGLFYPINCYGLDSEFIQSELFKNEDSVFNQSDYCFLYIQGIEQLSLEVQSLLLRAVQDQAHRVRFVASSREDLPSKIKAGKFLPELFHYLSQTMMIVPSLKERIEDIPELVNYFLSKNTHKKSINSRALKLFQSYAWNGNVVELKNTCERLNTLNEDDDVITVDHLLENMKDIRDLSFFVKYNPKITLEELTNYYISEGLKHFKSKKQVAQALGISVKTIYNKIEKGLV